MLSNLVRYHRKSLPSPEHLHFNVLPPEAKERVRRLAGLLRVALNLDRAHRASVLAAQVHLTDDSVLLQVHGAEALDLEIEAAMGARELFEQAFSRRLSIKGR
jgi:exopolyphosphatase/guanosine-5'-triphosphate,3'-diphosphate pyrophosphatase